MTAKQTTLKTNGDFRRAYSRGKISRNPALVTYAVKNRAGFCRIGITTSKKIGNAVKRNRSKRIILAAYMVLCPDIRGSFDLVFVARSATASIKSTELCTIMRTQLESLGLIQSSQGETP